MKRNYNFIDVDDLLISCEDAKREGKRKKYSDYQLSGITWKGIAKNNEEGSNF